MLLAFGLLQLVQARAEAQWLGLPDPPEPPDSYDPSTEPGSPAGGQQRSAGRGVAGPWHELTAGAMVTLDAHIVRRPTEPGAVYRINLAVRELSVQAAWTVFGRRALGVRIAGGLGVGRPVLALTRPLQIDWSDSDPPPTRLPGPSLSGDASLGMLARRGPVRFGPQVSYSVTRLRGAAGRTIDFDVPYTTPAWLRRAGLGFMVQVLPHRNVALLVETRVLATQHHVGAMLRLGLSAAWSGGRSGARR
ncbi:MAG: hypothetical protein H6725_03810 [Sandaracinaceae bacterium]|nr:hypothetical protein [Sandaracinaceae bacterium]